VALAPADALLDAYLGAPALEEAERALEALEQSPPVSGAPVGDLYDELAEAAANDGDFALAVRAERRAVELGCEHPLLAREMLAWYLIKDGQRMVGEAEFAALRGELGDDPSLLIALGCARADAGDEPQALAAFDEALAAAKQRGDPQAVGTARSERRYSRDKLGLPMDNEDRLARPVPVAVPDVERLVVALGWFPRDELAAALAEWPDLEDDLGDPDAYCRRIEAHLAEIKSAGGRACIAPFRVEEILQHAEREGLDPGDGSTRSGLALDLHERGETIAWPPERNQPCWCDSGRKYKRCCAAR
jgi:tetratricopeptide (TPR) repeat protein